MRQFTRQRWPRKDLIAKYRCSSCQRKTRFNVALRPISDGDPRPHIYGRPREVYCFPACGERLEYRGLGGRE